MSETSGSRFFELIHPGAPRGVLAKEPQHQKQDETAQPKEAYAVVFFPRISGIGPATLCWPRVQDTIAQTPEAAISKFIDSMAPGKDWATFHDAGHRVRRIKITDLGDAETGNTLATDAPLPDLLLTGRKA